MITLNLIIDYWIMLAWAAVFGAVGGLVFELLQNRGPGSGSGRVEEPRRFSRERLTELGWVASCIIGAAAAVAVLYFFPPTITIEEGGSTSSQYDLVSLVALSIIAGSSGPGVFKLAQESINRRLTAAVSEEQARATASEAQYYVQQVGNTAMSEAEGILRTAFSGQVAPALDQALQDPPLKQTGDRTVRIQEALEPVLQDSIDTLRERVGTRVDIAQEVLGRRAENA